MRYSTRLALGLTLLGCGFAASSVSAEPAGLPSIDQSGPYIRGEAGANFGSAPMSKDGQTKLETNVGPLGAIALGWASGNGLRTEIEGSYRWNGVNSFATRRVNGALVPLTNAGGDVASEAVMANLLYDLPIQGLHLPIQPYIGAGAGYEWSQFNTAGNGFASILVPPNVDVIGPSDVRLGSNSALAYQAIAGLSLPLAFAPRLSVTAEYRYFGTALAEVPLSRSIPGVVVNGVVPADTLSRAFAFHENSVMLGLRYSFGGP